MLPDSWRLTLAALTTFRLTWMFMFSDGPHKIWFKFKAWVGCYDYDKNGDPKKGIAQWLTCPYCVALAMAVPPTLLSIWSSTAGDAVLIWLGITGMVTILIRWRQWENG